MSEKVLRVIQRWRGCRRIVRRWERLLKGYTKVGEVAEVLY